MGITSVPYHQSENCFRRYEPIIREAIKAYPKAVSFKTDRSANTDAARCRDAIKSYRLYSWEVHDPHTFASLKDPRYTLNVWQADGKVIVGNKATSTLSKSNTSITIDGDFDGGISTSEDIDNRHVIVDPKVSTYLDYIIQLIDEGVFLFSISLDVSWHDQAVEFIGERLNVSCHIENDRLIIY